jgi:hypothetical protein
MAERASVDACRELVRHTCAEFLAEFDNGLVGH